MPISIIRFGTSGTSTGTRSAAPSGETSTMMAGWATGRGWLRATTLPHRGGLVDRATLHHAALAAAVGQGAHVTDSSADVFQT